MAREALSSTNRLNMRFDGPPPAWAKRTPRQRALELASARSLAKRLHEAQGKRWSKAPARPKPFFKSSIWLP